MVVIEEAGSLDLRKGTGSLLNLLAKQLEDVPLTPTGEEGEYLKVYKPGRPGFLVPVAVKVFDHRGEHFSQTEISNQGRFSEQEIEGVFNDKGYFAIKNREVDSLADLNQRERNFLFLALVHKQFEKFFSPYILPTVFIAYEREGETKYAMVQNHELLSQPALSIKVDELKPKQKKQLRDFADKLEGVFSSTGLFPDPEMWKKNLFFTKSSQLVLVDTNRLLDKETAGKETLLQLAKLIGEIKEKCPEGG